MMAKNKIIYSKYLLFIGLLVAPLYAVFCDTQILYFSLIYPIVALFTKKWNYFRTVFIFIFPPILLLIFMYFSNQQNSVFKLFRWILGIASGVYFASELGASGISSVLRSDFLFSFTYKLADIIDLGGRAIVGVRSNWSKFSKVSFSERMVCTVENSLVNAIAQENIKEKPITTSSIILAFIAWLFVLLVISGIEIF